MTGWGILGTGGISTRFAADLAHVPGARVVAVGSRERARASQFAARWGAARAHVEVEALAADPAVDVVYVGTPNARHAADVRACIAAGKAVLSEKPLTPTLAETTALVEAARARGVFLMEGLWTRFFPAMERVFEALPSLGEPRMLHADFGFAGDRASEPRLFDAAEAGGALLDVGVYPIWLALALLGPAAQISAARVMGPGGVDERTGLAIAHASGAVSALSCAITADTGGEAALFTERGVVRFDAPWWRPAAVSIAGERVEIPPLGDGFAHEAIEVMRCLDAGLLESPRLPHAMSCAIAAVVDEACR